MADTPQSHPRGFLRLRHYGEPSHMIPTWPSGIKALWWLILCVDDMVMNKNKMAEELLWLAFSTPSLKTMKKPWQTALLGGRLSEYDDVTPLLSSVPCMCLCNCYYCSAMLEIDSYGLLPLFALLHHPPFLAHLDSLLPHLGTDTFDLSAVLGWGKQSHNSLPPQPCWAQMHFAAFCSIWRLRATLLPLLSRSRSILQKHPRQMREESGWWHRGQGPQVQSLPTNHSSTPPLKLVICELTRVLSIPSSR